MTIFFALGALGGSMSMLMQVRAYLHTMLPFICVLAGCH